MDETFEHLQNRTIKAAKELRYDVHVIAALKNATTESELTRIMTSARQGLIGLEKFKKKEK